ncbi:MAG: response regulator [Proteobacteria bacterium]|jgi:CheY-like chemotaxis protein|nr:response regulator [Pseudomonadota bacterium]
MSERKQADNGTAIPAARILVIDDEEIVHRSLKRILLRQGHTVDAVLCAREGLDMLVGGDYDLVITDLMMPEINGIELLKTMKEWSLDVPTVMVTGYPTIRSAVEALRLGAVDYLAKPFTRQELLGPVNRAIRRGLDVPVEVEEEQSTGEGLNPPNLDLKPGDAFYLSEHSWAVFRQDGMMDVGIESSFLAAIGPVASIELPDDGDLVEQGYVGFKMLTESKELHCVFMPLSGQVVKVNGEVTAGDIDPFTWLVRLLPTAMELELELLKLRGR